MTLWLCFSRIQDVGWWVNPLVGLSIFKLYFQQKEKSTAEIPYGSHQLIGGLDFTLLAIIGKRKERNKHIKKTASSAENLCLN